MNMAIENAMDFDGVLEDAVQLLGEAADYAADRGTDGEHDWQQTYYNLRAVLDEMVTAIPGKVRDEIDAEWKEYDRQGDLADAQGATPWQM
jgi:hypothetical protein